MRTSLNEIKLIEGHLRGELDGGEETLLQAKLILNPALASNIAAQQATYRLVQSYGRKQLKLEIEKVQQKLFSEPEHRSFKQKILSLFGSV